MDQLLFVWLTDWLLIVTVPVVINIFGTLMINFMADFIAQFVNGNVLFFFCMLIY